MLAKRYFWLKLHAGWFDSKIIKRLRKIAGGDTYTIIYLKMMLLSLKNEGKIFYEGIEDDFAAELALELDEDEENVQVTVQFLERYGLLELIETDEYLLTEVPSTIGSESESARRVRKHRDNINRKKEDIKSLQCNADVTACNTDVQKCNTEIEKDIELDKDIEKDISCPELNSGPEPEPVIMLPLNTGEEYPVFQSDIDEFAELYPAVDVLQAMRGMKGWLKTNPAKRKTKKGIQRFMNSWLAKEQDKGGNSRYQKNRVPAQNNSFHNFSERTYDYDALENKLTGKR